EYGAINTNNLAASLGYGPCPTQAPQFHSCTQDFLNRLSVISVGGNATATATLLPTPPPNSPSSNVGEQLLDVTAVMGVAPGANYAFFEYGGPPGDDPNYNQDYNQAMLMMLTLMTEQVTVISSSWSLCENTATPTLTEAFAALAQQAAGQGISILFA